MKLVLAFMISTICSYSYAGSYDIDMTCGEVLEVSNGKILKRLEPNFGGLNSKFVLKTKFIAPVRYQIRGYSIDNYEIINSKESDEKVFTYFSLKDKYQSLKLDFKNALKMSKKENKPLFGCVGDIDLWMKYTGSHVFFSNESEEDAMRKMREQGARHL